MSLLGASRPTSTNSFHASVSLQVNNQPQSSLQCFYRQPILQGWKRWVKSFSRSYGFALYHKAATAISIFPLLPNFASLWPPFFLVISVRSCAMATSTTRRPVKYIQVKKNDRKEDPGAGQGAPGPEDAPARISWHPLVMMSMSFILGSGLAVGHHFFYAHWDGKDITTTISQAWITRIGTAFAFLVKVFLAVATGIAYIQQLWSSLRSQPMKVKRLNSAFSVLGDVTRLFDAGLWFRNPLLLLPALITWCDIRCTF